MVSTGQRVHCSKAVCRIVENLGERHQGLDQGSGRGWRRKDGHLRHGRGVIRCGSVEERSLPPEKWLRRSYLGQVNAG